MRRRMIFLKWTVALQVRKSCVASERMCQRGDWSLYRKVPASVQGCQDSDSEHGVPGDRWSFPWSTYHACSRESLNFTQTIFNALGINIYNFKLVSFSSKYYNMFKNFLTSLLDYFYLLLWGGRSWDMIMVASYELKHKKIVLLIKLSLKLCWWASRASYSHLSKDIMEPDQVFS